MTEHHRTAIVWVVDHERRHLLLVAHRLLGWSCPGSHLDPGETFREAAHRELGEELGSAVAAQVDPTAMPLVSGAQTRGCARTGPDTLHSTLGFVAAIEGTSELTTEPGQDARWFAFDDLPDDGPPDLVPMAERILRHHP